jgi:predicted RNase H-like HicB family nuclease
MVARYTVLLFPEEGSYSVLVPALDNLATQGQTVEEALAMAREAIDLYLEGLRARGEYVPTEETPPIVTSVEADSPVEAHA